ncbi:putative disulfide interchange protein [Staphylococcus aureus]|uniref:Putative disulfide interchange protein n=1 Tax=Staphylococcus aureus TaxID=1280 RepID=A0A8S1IBL9_STAAU|nr:putative disulfide interchange protein [Staphylococcus aureus]
MGILIALLGLGMLFGKHLPIKIGSFQVKPGKWSIYFYGIAYAVTSLGCTLPAFMLVVSASLNDNSVTAVIIKFIIYSLGMGIVVTAITMVSLISRQLVQKFLAQLYGFYPKNSSCCDFPLRFVHGLLLVFRFWWHLYILKSNRSGVTKNR